MSQISCWGAENFVKLLGEETLFVSCFSFCSPFNIQNLHLVKEHWNQNKPYTLTQTNVFGLKNIT